MDPDDSVQPHVHFSGEDSFGKDNDVVVLATSDSKVTVHVGFLKVQHKYEVQVSIPREACVAMGSANVELQEWLPSGIPSLHARLVSLREDSGSVLLTVHLLAHKEKLQKEEICLRAAGQENHVCITFVARVLGNTFVKKWRNIKDNYMKSLRRKTKSGQAADSGRSYIYARQLYFLHTTAGSPIETQSSIEGEEAQDDSLNKPSGQNNADETCADSATRRFCRHHGISGTSGQQSLQSSLINFMNTPIPSATPIPQEANADRSFFDSLLPALKHFSEDHKLDFRGEVINLVKRMRMSPQSVTHSQGMSSQYAPSPQQCVTPTQQYPASTDYATQHSPCTSIPYPPMQLHSTHNFNFSTQTLGVQPSSKRLTATITSQSNTTELSPNMNRSSSGSALNPLTPSTPSSNNSDFQPDEDDDCFNIFQQSLIK